MAQWEEDKSTDKCCSCEEAFTAFRRRHHCRQCGKLFCNLCCLARVELPQYTIPQRVCSVCLQSLRPEDGKSTLELEEAIAVRNQLNESLKIALKSKSQSLEACRTFLVRFLAAMMQPSTGCDSNTGDIESGEDDDAISGLLEQCEKAVELIKIERKSLSKQVGMLKKTTVRQERVITSKTQLIEELEAQICDLQSSLHGHTLRVAEHHKLRTAAIEELTAELAAEKAKTRKLTKIIKENPKCNNNNVILSTSTTRTTSGHHVVRWRSEDHGDHWALRLTDPLIRVHSNGSGNNSSSSTTTIVSYNILLAIWRTIRSCCCFCCWRRSSRRPNTTTNPSIIGNHFL